MSSGLKKILIRQNNQEVNIIPRIKRKKIEMLLNGLIIILGVGIMTQQEQDVLILDQKDIIGMGQEE